MGNFHGKISLFMGAQENGEIAGLGHCSSDPCDAGCLCLLCLAVAAAALDRPCCDSRITTSSQQCSLGMIAVS